MTHGLLALIAAGSVLQALCLALIVIKGRQAAARLEEIERELRPRLARAGAVVEDVAALTESASRNIVEMESTLRGAATRVRRAGELFETFAVMPLRPLARALALWRGVRYGADVYRRLRDPHP